MLQAVKLTTNCGAPLFVVEMPNANSVATGVLVNAGTRDEIWPGQAGLAHAFEHMVFRGNAKFPTSQAVAGYLEKVGGKVNAWTNQEMTFFYNVVPANHFEKAADYLHELLATPTCGPRDIELEMQNIVEEIKRFNDTPMALALDTSESLAYGDHPLANHTLGTAETVSAFNHDHFVQWQKKFYNPGNFSFLVVGRISPDEALKAFNAYFLEPSGIRNLRQPISSWSLKEKSAVLEKDINQANVALAAPIASASHRSTKALALFQAMLNGGMSFPLFQEVREKRGLCYHVAVYVSAATDAGVFQFFVGTSPEKVGLALKTIFEVTGANRANEKLFEEAKELLKGRIALSNEAPAAMLSKLAYDIALEGRPKLVQETLEEIEGITLKEVTDAVDQYLGQENFVRVFVAPKGFRPE